MKIKLFTLVSFVIVLLTCCTVEKPDPVLEIYVTTEISDKWTDAEIRVGNVRFVSASDSSDGTSSSLQSFWGTNYGVELNEPQTTLIYNNSHFDYEELLAFGFLSSSVQLGNADSGLRRVSIQFHDPIELEETVAIENGKSYRLDFFLDLDELVSEVNGELIFDPSYTIAVEEL